MFVKKIIIKLILRNLNVIYLKFVYKRGTEHISICYGTFRVCYCSWALVCVLLYTILDAVRKITTEVPATVELLRSNVRRLCAETFFSFMARGKRFSPSEDRVPAKRFVRFGVRTTWRTHQVRHRLINCCRRKNNGNRLSIGYWRITVWIVRKHFVWNHNYRLSLSSTVTYTLHADRSVCFVENHRRKSTGNFGPKTCSVP